MAKKKGSPRKRAKPKLKPEIQKAAGENHTAENGSLSPASTKPKRLPSRGKKAGGGRASGVKGKRRFINRELSWLEFNQRVLEEARNPSLPLLERLKFLAISASNLDEFFMVRVGSLQLLVSQGYVGTDASGLTMGEQLTLVRSRAQQMVHDQYSSFLAIEARLAAAGIHRVRGNQLSAEQIRFLHRLFETELYPLLTPIAIEPEQDFPHLSSLALHLYIRLSRKGGEERIAFLSIPRSFPRFLTLPAPSGYHYILAEEVLSLFLFQLFPGEEVMESFPFRLSRNAEMSLDEDLVADLLQEMENLLAERKESPCVRLEVSELASSVALEFLQEKLGVSSQGIYPVTGPLDLAAFAFLAQLPGFDPLRDEPWPPQPSPGLDSQEPLFEQLAQKDVLLCHPYESFDPVVRFLQEAAIDPEVLAIKQILYRTSQNSPIVAALAEAAQRGKQVTAIVELKARFDEARNIDWARALERAGVQVIYGIRHLKTHAKLCIVLRREREGIRRYLHFGTGNYNESTARLYSDVSYMTCDDEYGRDASAFFNSITGLTQPGPYSLLAAAPNGIRKRLLELIASETARARQGQKGQIIAKINSLVDADIIKALCKASQAGVKILLNVRGICCLRPNMPKLSENITVISIVDRFLEHARILYFGQGGEPKVYISSADWMPRNLDRRIELLIPVRDASAKGRLIGILQAYFQDTEKAWKLLPSGEYTRVRPDRKLKASRAQEVLYRRAVEAAEQSRSADRAQFQPYRSPEKETM
jgi:polyphosphate kinase